jgi:hypothetical protein
VKKSLKGLMKTKEKNHSHGTEFIEFKYTEHTH